MKNISTVLCLVAVLSLTACGKNDAQPVVPANISFLPHDGPKETPAPIAAPIPAPKAEEFKPTALAADAYVGVTKAEDMAAIAAAATGRDFTDEELARMFNPGTLYIADAFDKQAAIKASATRARGLLTRWKGTKGVTLDVDMSNTGMDHFDFTKSTFGTKQLTDGITGARYATNLESRDSLAGGIAMPAFDLSDTPESMASYKPASTDEAKGLEHAIGDYYSKGYVARYQAQIISATFEGGRTILKLAVVAVDLKDKATGKTLVSLRAL